MSAFPSIWLCNDPHIPACVYRASSQGKLSLQCNWGNWAGKHCEIMNMEQQNFILKAILNFVAFTLKNKQNPPPKLPQTTRGCPHLNKTDCGRYPPPQETIESCRFNRILEELSPISVLKIRSSFGLQSHPAWFWTYFGEKGKVILLSLAALIELMCDCWLIRGR